MFTGLRYVARQIVNFTDHTPIVNRKSVWLASSQITCQFVNDGWKCKLFWNSPAAREPTIGTQAIGPFVKCDAMDCSRRVKFIASVRTTSSRVLP
jgi:hypothetical protein